MRELRHYGVYLPPGGLRPVYALRDGGVYRLYDSEYGGRLPPRFIVRPEGAVTNWHGEPANWSVEELADTGETYEPH